MIDGPFRKLLPSISGPLIGLYRQLGLSPNQVTMIGCAFAFVAAGAAAMDWAWLAIALWWIGRLFDGTDGVHARATDQVTPFGGYLDILLDMLSYSVMILGFSLRRPDLAFVWSLILLLYVLCITSALALGNLEREHAVETHADNRSLRLSAGLAEGGETGIAYTLMLLFPQYLGVLAGLWIIVLTVTVVARTLLARRILAGAAR